MENILKYLFNPIKILVFLTLIFAIYGLNRRKRSHIYLLTILIICFATELLNSILKSNGVSTNLTTTISVILHHTFWLLLLTRFVVFKSVSDGLLFAFVLFSVLNILFIEKTEHFNYYTFVTGAFIYIVIFIYESFYQLRKENFTFFFSNDYTLLFAPVLFFFGLSFMFGFKSKAVTSYMILNDVKLYDFIVYFVNIVYYTLIIVYIYREKKLKNAG